MAHIVVTPEELLEVFHDRESKRPAAVSRGVLSAALLGAEVQARAAPKDLGNLKRSARAVNESPGAYIIIDAPYAGIVEMGARPHWVPLGPLVAWCRRHGDPRTAWARARGIQAKIAREGQAPTYFVRRTLPTLRKILKIEVERELHGDGG